jgi:hypothetical protein
MYANNEILFPNYVIPLIRDMRGEEWRHLIDHVLGVPDDHPDKLALILMMVRLHGCMECETDSYRAMRGCAMCAAQTLHRYHGSDRDLFKMYDKAMTDVQAYLVSVQQRGVRTA